MDSILSEALSSAVLYAPTVGVIATLSLIASFLIILVSDLIYCGFKTWAVQWAPCIPGKSLLSERFRLKKSMDDYYEEFADAYRKASFSASMMVSGSHSQF